MNTKPTLRTLRLKGQLALAFGAVLLLMLGLGALATFEMTNLRRMAAALNEHHLPTVRLTLVLQATMNEFRAQEFEHILAADQGERGLNERRMAALDTAFAAAWGQLSALGGDAETLRDLGSLKETWTAYMSEHRKIAKLAQEDKSDTARALIRAHSLKLFGAATQTLERLVAQAATLADAAEANSRRRAERALNTLFGGLLVALGLGSFTAWRLGRDIAGAMQRACAAARRVADGELTLDLSSNRGDEIGELYAALGSMANSLARLVGEVQASASHVASAADEIASGTQDLSERTEQQAGELQATASRLRRLTEVARHHAGLAEQARGVAAHTRGAADQGGTAVGSVIEGMARLGQASQRVTDICAVIDSIAFQTNILALNAAVEAARAGTHGRGFAVVATEVRQLAQRASSAAKEIRALITDSVQQIRGGTQLAADAGTTMRQIVESVQDLDRIVADLSSASSGQRDEVHQLAETVDRLEDSTQRNAAMVEQSAAASSGLSTQARRLNQAAAAFHV